MTVTIPAKHELVPGDSSDNETCCATCDDGPKEVSHIHDHTESLLEDLSACEDEQDKSEIPDDDVYYEKARRLLTYDEAPKYMQHNSYIRNGYRGILNTELCKESIFWWTNETINIWSHIFGLILFISLTIYDLMILKIDAPLSDKILVGTILICFQVCMGLSALYHTYCCRSEEDCHYFLSYDLFGIALSLFGIYVSGIYYAFFCEPFLQNFYLITVTVIFIIAMILQVPSLGINDNVKIATFVSWAAYGVVPTFHWGYKMGWFENPIVSLLLPRVLGMYVISGTAFLIYITKIPERWAAGKFDFLGHSHQWWHFFVIGALYYWHNSGIMYVDYRLNHACTNMLYVATRISGHVNTPWTKPAILLLPRVIGMYVISGTAFVIYIGKIPERWAAGKFDFIGHSHQWWHMFVVGALYYWHNTGLLYVDYRLNHACGNSMRIS